MSGVLLVRGPHFENHCAQVALALCVLSSDTACDSFWDVHRFQKGVSRAVPRGQQAHFLERQPNTSGANAVNTAPVGWMGNYFLVGGESWRARTCAAKRTVAKDHPGKAGSLPSESHPSSYLVNKDILLGVIPAGQDGVLGDDFGKALTSAEASSCPFPRPVAPSSLPSIAAWG